MEICDPHHHLWEYPHSVYLIDDLKRDAAGLQVTKTVFVECGSAYRTAGPEAERPVGETEWVRRLAAEDGLVSAIVGFADLSLGAAVEPVLRAHVEAGDGMFRGIRHVNAWDGDDRIRPSHTNPPPDLMRQPAFADGFAALGRLGLSFDAWMYFPQLPELVDLVRAHPETPVILDHIGGPIGIGPYAGRRDDILAEWRASMSDLAACESIVLKLGGIGMPIFGMGWHRRDGGASADELVEAWGPEIRWLIETFGVDRCMFESNFPVDKASCSYRTLWDAFDLMTADASEGERQALFHDTAVRAYRLG